MPKQAASKTSTIQIRVADHIREDIDLYARDRGMTTSEFVRYCVYTYMDSTPSSEEDEIEQNESKRNIEAASGRAVEIGEVRKG